VQGVQGPTLRTLWKHCNNCVFDGVSPNLIRVLQLAGEELHFWGLAGLKVFHTFLPWGQTKFVGLGRGQTRL
jgi:hypothetical protein